MSEINVNDFKTNEKDTGSTGFQVAVLTKRIVHLTEHLKANKHDHASRRGLLMMVAKRRKMLDYAKRTNPDLYTDLLVRLSLRHSSDGTERFSPKEAAIRIQKSRGVPSAAFLVHIYAPRSFTIMGT